MVTYCTNIHPGERWEEVQSALAANVPQIRAAVAPGETFPVGIWLSGRAAQEAEQAGTERFDAFLREHDLVIRSINGFPFGDFHAGRVKEQVYLPDWRDPARLDYTLRLARLLARWLPDGETGVISSVPLHFKDASRDDGRANVRKAVEGLDAIAQKTGKQIVLALEAEPGCRLETTPEVIDFFAQLPKSAHLGICFDCCHHAVEFEDPAASLALLAQAGVRIAQAHVTAALRVPGRELESLRQFSEPVYLHQTVGRRGDGSLVRFDDLPLALAASPDGVEEWRVHFHVPVFAEQLGSIRTTQPELLRMLRALPKETPLVVETYTFGVLPPELQAKSMADSIIRELRWVRAHS